jgi:hypothetical protein
LIIKRILLNKKTNEYEKKLKLKKRKKDTEIILKALKTTNTDEITGK